MKVERDQLVATLSGLKKKGFSYLVKITAVDYINYLEVIYFIRDLPDSRDETVEVEIDAADAYLPTVMNLYRAADWYEREVYEMFGIEIRGRHILRLLLEKWNGKNAPLRKAFLWNAPYDKME